MLRGVLALAALLPMLMPAGMCLCDGCFHLDAHPCDGSPPDDESPAAETGSEHECHCAFRSLERGRIAPPPAAGGQVSFAVLPQQLRAASPSSRELREPLPESRGDPPRYLTLLVLLI